MTREQFAALKPGDRVLIWVPTLARGFDGTVHEVGIPDRVMVEDEYGGLIACGVADLLLPDTDTETPPLFEEDGA